MIRLILDLGIEAVGLHLCHHTGEADNIGVVLVRRCHQLGSEPDMPLEVCKVFDPERLAVFLFCRHNSNSTPYSSSGDHWMVKSASSMLSQWSCRNSSSVSARILKYATSSGVALTVSPSP